MSTQPSPARRSPSPKPQPRWYDVMVVGLGVAFFVALAVAAYIVHDVVRQTVATGGGFALDRFNAQPTQPLPGSTQPVPTPTLVPLEATAPPWTGNSRVTVLVMGLDYRDWLAGSGAPRTDTMMLVSIDPLTLKAGMLSIPRDLWVEIPGFGFNRINTAYTYGESNRLPGGGPGLAVKTVESVIGVPIQYYAVIDFSAFERMIDEIGGVDVLVTDRIKISPIGQMSIWLEPKAYHLDGAQTLAYARVRKGAGDDFGRAQRQQQVALAIIDRVVGFNMVPTLITRAPRLYQEISSGIRTNMSLQDMVSLGWLAVHIPRSDIANGVIAPPKMVGFYTRPDGAQVLRPVPDQIRVLRDQIFVNSSALGPSVTPIEGASQP
jgi:LCP family protein required for cell wall assembly